MKKVFEKSRSLLLLFAVFIGYLFLRIPSAENYYENYCMTSEDYGQRLNNNNGYISIITKYSDGAGPIEPIVMHHRINLSGLGYVYQTGYFEYGAKYTDDTSINLYMKKSSNIYFLTVSKEQQKVEHEIGFITNYCAKKLQNFTDIQGLKIKTY